LVPACHLDKRLKYHIKQIKALGIKNEAVILDRAIELVAKDFVVSQEVIRRRLMNFKIYGTPEGTRKIS